MAGNSASAARSADATPPAIRGPRTRTAGMPDSANVHMAAEIARPEMSTPRPVSTTVRLIASRLGTRLPTSR